MLLDPRCAICGDRGAVVCAACEAALQPGPPLATPLHLDSCAALFTYDDACRPLITGLKNRHRRDAVAWLAGRMATQPGRRAALVTWAPTGTERAQRRGFDQAELLARALARRLRVPSRPLLRRLPGPPQSGRSGGERRSNPAFAPRRPVPRSVLLVDDVVTTGATLTAAARALRAGGADVVDALVAARTPR